MTLAGAIPFAEPRTEGEVMSPGGAVHLRRTRWGYLEVQPRADPQQVQDFYAAEYHEKVRPGRIKKWRRDLAYWRRVWSIREKLMRDAIGGEPGRVLDVGCSAGFLIEFLRDSGWQVQGIEPSGEAVTHARHELQLPVHHGSLESFSTDQTYDAIHCAQVLEHVVDVETFVQRLASLLRPGGVLWLEVPNDFSILQTVAQAKYDKPAWWVVPDHHLNYFGFDSLSQLIAGYGLVELDRLASFPMEMFLLMGLDYVGDKQQGDQCHQQRMLFESALIDSGGIRACADFQRGMAQAGFGRTCQLLASKRL